AVGKTGGNCVNDGALFVIRDGTITAENPDDGLVFVTRAEEAAVFARVLEIQDAGARGPVTAPGWKHADEQAECGGFVDDEINVVEISFVGLGGITVSERSVAVGVRSHRTIHAGEYAGLNDGEAFARAIRKIFSGFFAIEAMEKFPRSVAEIEKRYSVVVLKVAMVCGYAETRSGGGFSILQKQLKNECQHHNLDHTSLHRHDSLRGRP